MSELHALVKQVTNKMNLKVTSFSKKYFDYLMEQKFNVETFDLLPKFCFK